MARDFARIALSLGAASMLLGLSVRASSEALLGGRLSAVDEDILRSFSSLRRGWLNAAAVDLTALGSGTLLVITTAAVLLMLSSTRDSLGALHLACAGVGAALLTGAFKRLFGRPRPSVVEHLVHVASSSYPSGHALVTAACYFSFAMVARRHLPRHISREVLIGFTLFGILLVGLSRVYLGVHYFSDVVAGILIGVGWSLLLAGLFTRLERRSRRGAPDATRA